MWQKYILVISLAASFCCSHRPGPIPTEYLRRTTGRGDSVCFASGINQRQVFTLPDSTRVILNPNSVVRMARDFGGRVLVLDGDAMFEGAPGTIPFVIRTRNLVLKVGDPASAAGAGPGASLRVSAFSRDEGESAEVLSGAVRADKAYASPDQETDTLRGGDMIMINRSIDLMEKETYDTAELHIWKIGTLAFNHTPFDTVVQRLQDWFGVGIDVTGDAGSHARASGTFPNGRLDQVLDELSSSFSFRYSVGKDSVKIRF